ncbi:hypothetical protein [Nannocystis pusilla]|uniref:hypothetical protein n=1 Tax=Nannocystis pusilla TaxID=889268 RepID=UPI003B785CC6
MSSASQTSGWASHPAAVVSLAPVVSLSPVVDASVVEEVTVVAVVDVPVLEPVALPSALESVALAPPPVVVGTSDALDEAASVLVAVVVLALADEPVSPGRPSSPQANTASTAIVRPTGPYFIGENVAAAGLLENLLAASTCVDRRERTMTGRRSVESFERNRIGVLTERGPVSAGADTR